MLNTLRTAIYVNPSVAALPGVMTLRVDLFQPAKRRHAQRDGYQELSMIRKVGTGFPATNAKRLRGDHAQTKKKIR